MNAVAMLVTSDGVATRLRRVTSMSISPDYFHIKKNISFCFLLHSACLLKEVGCGR